MENETKLSQIKTKYQEFKAENPKVRIRDAAKQLGVTEAELVATGDTNIQLKPLMKEILNSITPLGKVMALTRNESAVHERKGVYSKAVFQGPSVGLVVGEDIDLRFFMEKWSSVFAVEDNGRQSIQFFDRNGEAIHKIFLTDDSNKDAYDELVEKFKFDEEHHQFEINEHPNDLEIELPDEDIEIENFRKEWVGLQDTHDFFGMLKKHKVTRRQSMRIAPEGYAKEVDKSKIEELLNTVSEKGIDFMVFIGNQNCIQIHTGKAQRIVRTGPWINILDPDFNMHLNDESIESVWIVKKSTNLGPVHSIEAYDNKGELIVQFFGKRKPNIPEREDWIEVVNSL